MQHILCLIHTSIHIFDYPAHFVAKIVTWICLQNINDKGGTKFWLSTQLWCVFSTYLGKIDSAQTKNMMILFIIVELFFFCVVFVLIDYNILICIYILWYLLFEPKCVGCQSLDIITQLQESGPRLNIKTIFPRYGNFHVKDKTVLRSS